MDGGGKDADEIIRRAGDTPLIIRTPSGGFHFYYRSNGERSANLRSVGLAVDVRGSSAGIIIVPPSFRRSTGVPYKFERGDWDDLDRLPLAKPGSLSVEFPGTGGSKLPIERGQRNTSFSRPHFEKPVIATIWNRSSTKLRTINDGLPEPLPDTEIVRLATSAWGYETTGANWVGQAATSSA